MTITLHWWTLPAVLTALYFLWCLLPVSGSTLYDGVKAVLYVTSGLIGVLLSWTVAAVFFK